ncbi:unnamed protein product [Amoebophrya sp. A120]|nr:unnamed protein product [Amoebophrya sp. A120]|eukprot:GSA120T00012344001.1
MGKSKKKNSVNHKAGNPSNGGGAANTTSPVVEPDVAEQAGTSTAEEEETTVEFENAGQKTGIEVWRIEQMKAVPWTDFGQFYSGDSYLVLHTIAVKKKYDLYYWLGKDSSVDEKGAAALKTVELDTKLGDLPVQYRECENYESGPFLALWKAYGGIRYLQGGADSAFRHVEATVYESRLLHVKGKRLCRVTQVDKSIKSMNQGDAFVLDAGLKIFVYCGKECNKYESQKAFEIARVLKTERNSKPEVFDCKTVASEEAALDFWKELGGEQSLSEADVPAADAGGSDELHEQVSAEKIKLYEMVLSTAGDDKDHYELKPVENAKVPFKSKDEFLKDDGVFVLDSGAPQPGLFVWLGKKADAGLRKKAVKTATDWLGKQGLPEYTGIARMDAGTEPALFKTYFAQFDPVKLPSTLDVQRSTSIAETRESEVSIANMHDNNKLKPGANTRRKSLPAVARAKESESLKIWRIEQFEAKEIPEDSYGEFYAGDSYIIEYVYRTSPGGKIEEALLYFWQGEDSTADEKGASAILCAKFDTERFGGQATQIRVVQGKEPSNFLRLFAGKMILHKGGCDSGFRSTRASAEETSGDSKSDLKLYHIRGLTPSECKALEITVDAKLLNSNDVLALVSATKSSYLWVGKGASAEEQELGKELCTKLLANKTASTTSSSTTTPLFETITEGSEPDSFWELFPNGKEPYADNPVLFEAEFEPRLFQVSNASGALRVEEVYQFTQTDLIDEDVMLLDTYNSVFVWVGDLSHPEEQKEAPKIAESYVKSAPDGRSVEETPIVVVKQGNEPLLFTCHFVGWDSSKKKGFSDVYEEALKRRNSQLQQQKDEEEKALQEEAEKRAEKVRLMEQQREEEAKQKRESKNKDDSATTAAPWVKKEQNPSAGDSTAERNSTKESNPQDANKTLAKSPTDGGKKTTSGTPESPVTRRTSVKGTRRRSSITRCCVGGGGGSCTTDSPAAQESDQKKNNLVSTSKDSSTTASSFAEQQGGAGASDKKPKLEKGANGRWSTVDTGGYIGFANVSRSSRVSSTMVGEGDLKNENDKLEGKKDAVEESYACPRKTKYSLTELQHGKRPSDVDPTKKEHYLPDEEFHSVFSLSLDDWEKLPVWKRTQKKKEKGLF